MNSKIKVVKKPVSHKDKEAFAKERKELEAAYEERFVKKMPSDEEHRKESIKFMKKPDPIAHAHRMSKVSPKKMFKKSMDKLNSLMEK